MNDLRMKRKKLLVTVKKMINDVDNRQQSLYTFTY